MREANAPTLGVNSWLEEELYQQYRLNHESVDDGWGDLFIQLDENAAPVAVEEPPPRPSRKMASSTRPRPQLNLWPPCRNLPHRNRTHRNRIDSCCRRARRTSAQAPQAPVPAPAAAAPPCPPSP